MATINYKPGQILYIQSEYGSFYISILRCATPVEHMDNIYEIHTVCDLTVDEYNGEMYSGSITFERGNGSLLDMSDAFETIREAHDFEKKLLYDALVKAFKDYDLDWDNHFTDSSYFDIFDWLCSEFDINIESLDPRNPSPIEDTINEIQNYIWNSLCKETGNDHACTDYIEPEMVNKQEFIEKLEKWIRINTDWTDEYIWDGRNPNYGLWDELRKFMEE